MNLFLRSENAIFLIVFLTFAARTARECLEDSSMIVEVKRIHRRAIRNFPRSMSEFQGLQARRYTTEPSALLLFTSPAEGLAASLVALPTGRPRQLGQTAATDDHSPRQ